jgi:hypothetical protein
MVFGLLVFRPLFTFQTNLENQRLKYSSRLRKRFCEITETTLNNGYLGSRNDEERSEMRYVV